MAIECKPAKDCKYDIVSLGEIMLRLDPGDDRIHTTRQFRVWEGGGEYNVRSWSQTLFRQAGGGRDRSRRESGG